MDLFSSEKVHTEIELTPTKADFYPNFLSKEQADYLLKNLIENVEWKQVMVSSTKPQKSVFLCFFDGLSLERFRHVLF